MSTVNGGQVDRAIRRIARAELERRWSLVKQHLALHGLDALIAFAVDDYLSPNVRYLTDRPTFFAQRTALLFAADASMTIVEHGNFNGRRPSNGMEADFPGITEILTAPTFHSVEYTTSLEGELISTILDQRKYARVGIAGMGAMPYGFIQALRSANRVELVDTTQLLDDLRAVKSRIELDEIRATAAMQDRLFAKLISEIRPGMRDMDVQAIILSASRKEGSSQNVFFVGSSADDDIPFPQMPFWQGRTIERGDCVTILIECNGAGGYYTELGRTIVLGKASPERLEAHALACAAQADSVRHYVPGADCAQIAAVQNAFRKSHGLPPEKRLYAHGQGYALVERPLMRSDETMKLAAGMCLVTHPGFVRGNSFGWICDNHVVRDDGPPERLHRTEQRIFEVNT